MKKFIVKRVLVLFAIFSTVTIIFLSQRWMVLAGLTAGAAFGVFKFLKTADVFAVVLSADNRGFSLKRGVSSLFIGQLLTIALLALAIKQSLWLFAGLLPGIMLVPLTIMLNGLTEGFGITHNRFE